MVLFVNNIIINQLLINHVIIIIFYRSVMNLFKTNLLFHIFQNFDLLIVITVIFIILRLFDGKY